ncbi:unnamed protein product [Cylindrotheca closterium]|uniref:Uncharacterized protein n=1 Tax=Cylindrotheca closterium TaxID=2856 RepID=A0AAD2CT06_9STRA|nr:unnamed protein product [Cylindrotheca closterium]
MHTNVGSRVLDKEGFLGRFPPPVYYDEYKIANVLAVREMIAAGYRITMDTDADNAFIVHCDENRKMRFVNRKGVYVLEQLGANVEPGAKETSAMCHRQLSNLNNQPHFKLSSNKKNGYAGLEMTSKMATVRKNKEGFTPRQVKAAMEARSARHILNAPSTKSLNYANRSDLVSSDDDSGDEGGEEEERIVADLDHHQENVNRGTDDIGSLVTDLEDLQEPPEEEIVFEPEEPQEAKVTRSGQTYAQAAMSGLNLSQVPKRPREWPSSRSGSSDNKNKN